MKIRKYGACLATSIAAVLAIALFAGGRAKAQGGPQRSTFTATLAGQLAPFFVVPIDPPIISARQRLNGTSAFFGGPVSWVDKHTEQFAATQAPFQFTDGTGVLSQANGEDAVFINWNAVDRSGQDPLNRTSEGVATITGGRGRFRGASGHGTMVSNVDLRQGTVSIQLTATVEY